MNHYTVATAAINIVSGLLRLTPEQVKTRLHNLKDRGKGVYEVLRPVQFKKGEQFYYDGTMPKDMAQQAITPEQAKAEADAKAKEEKKAKAEAEKEASARKKAEEIAAVEKAKAMEQAIGDADKAVDAARKAMTGLGVKLGAEIKQDIEDTIDNMALFVNEEDVKGLLSATTILVEKTGQLDKNPKS